MVFTADHGESLGEHNIFFEHHFNVYEERVRVPLAMLLDGRLPIHRGLANRLEAMIAQVRGYKLPFVLTEYEMPMRERPGFVEQHRQDDCRIVKTLAEDQIERLRALGYVN